MSSFTSSDKPVAAAAAGAFALAVAYFSYASAKNAATAAKASSSSSAAGVASPLSTSSPVGGARKAPSGNFHADPASLGACAANNPSGFIVSNSEDDYSPSILDNTGETVASFAPEPFPDADVAAFFAAFGVPSVGKNKEDADKKSAAGNDDTTGANAASSAAVSSSSFVTAGRTSEDVMAQCGALMASDAAFDGLKADAATDVVERAANLLAYVEWKNNQQLQEQQRSKSDEVTVASPPEQAGMATSVSDGVTAPPVLPSPSGTSSAAPAPSKEQLAALSTLVDARVDTIEKWREHEAPIIRSVVRMLRDVREELANIDHYKADGHAGEGNSVAQKTAAGDNTDNQQTTVVADGEASKDTVRAPDVSPPSVVAADAGLATAGEAEGEGEEQLVKRRNSIHPELVARTAVDIRERIRRLRGILEKLHTPLRELGPIGDLCNQLEAIASVLAGSD